MWYIVSWETDWVDNKQIIDTTGVPNRYGKKKLFKKKKDAQAWIDKRFDPYSARRYEIRKEEE